MLLVRQRGSYDCGVAVAAMVAQVRYEAVLDRLITGLSAGNPLRGLDVWRTLEDVTQKAWWMDELWTPWLQVGTYPFPDGPTAVLTQRADGSRHYVAVSGGLVYDPLLGVPFVQNEYPGKDSWVVTIFRPKTVVASSSC
jgi:hypothetical protein